MSMLMIIAVLILAISVISAGANELHSKLPSMPSAALSDRSLRRSDLRTPARKRKNAAAHKFQSQSLNDASTELLVAAKLEDDSQLSGDEKAAAMKQAVKNTIVTMTAAFLFGIGTWVMKGRTSAMQYYTGFLVEKSLSIDNLFVFLMLFDYFRIPYRLQNRVLTWGLMGAVVMRGFMIFLGVAAIEKFKWVTLLFAAILLLSGFKLMHEDDSGGDVSENAVMKLSKYLIRATDKLDGEKFFTRGIDGKKLATPLLTCLICIELSDFVFAVDSIPAVLGVSKDPFIVYSSNIFAILGMRSLYILISQAVSELKYIRPAVAAVLVFVGLKMVAEYFEYEISSFQSLLVILSILTTGLVASIVAQKKEAAAVASGAGKSK